MLPTSNSFTLPTLSPFWKLSDDGWVLSEQEDLLFWLPPDFRPGFYMPLSTKVISHHKVNFSYENFMHGDNWTKCYSAIQLSA
ncbi:WD40 repeat-like protein [Mycena indigotica]|uniref:WD40 repeat-like protein n=1 Tax=Mycena indigotica TaxID=2126181 RepID=A0A8H6W936_9AGAR|nr:WD40 repeat-like protein [Mycena indigotica]KAF7309317.1 WD40 repeat-like protein [Mycena indigotica]